MRPDTLNWQIAVVALIACHHLQLITEARPPLKFHDDHFKILQLADLHYGGFSEDDALTDALQQRLLDVETPDLVVFSGDLVSGYLWNASLGSGWFADRWQQLMLPVEKAGVPWALTLGNHDGEADLRAEQIIEMTKTKSPLSCTTQGPDSVEGVSNYHLDIDSSSGTDTAARIWLLDSLEYGCDGHPGWGCVGPTAVAWLQRSAQQLPQAPSLAFVHIPVPEFLTAWHHGLAKGSKAEPVNCPSADTDLLSVLLDANVTAVFSGHDHDNNYDAMHPAGMRLAYGHKTGYGSYGPPPAWLHGARVILLREGQPAKDAESWIRLENGTRIDQGLASANEIAASQQAACDGSTAYCYQHESGRQCRDYMPAPTRAQAQAHVEL